MRNNSSNREAAPFMPVPDQRYHRKRTCTTPDFPGVFIENTHMLAYVWGQVLCFMAVLHKWLTGLLCSCLLGTVHADFLSGEVALLDFS